VVAELLATVVAAASPCPSDDLKLVYKGFDGAAGTGYELFRLVPRRNFGCHLGGYPGIALLDSRGHKAIHVGRYHDARHPVRTLLFSRRQPARFDIRHPDANRRTGKPCAHRIVAVQVIPPNSTRVITHNFRRALHLCKAGAVVSPVGRHY
jgi:hypothetical protein